MDTAIDIGIRRAWREHVTAATNWQGLMEGRAFSEIGFVSVCLDLFFGGSLLHEIKNNSFQCEGCQFAKNMELCPACQVHLGVIEAFVQTLVDKSLTAYRMVEDQVCKILIEK